VGSIRPVSLFTLTIFFCVAAAIDDTQSVRIQFTSVLRLTSVTSTIYDYILGYAFRTVYHIYNKTRTLNTYQGH
jgi:hypothetical protein